MEQNKNSKMKFAVVVTLIALGLLAWLLVVNSNQEAERVEAGQIDVTGQPTLGEEGAPVTVVEFGDFKCPSCKAWGEVIYPQLVEDYVDTGQVEFSYVNVLFHGEESTLAAIAAESVWMNSPESYWAFHKALFAAQPAEDHDAAWITPDKVLEIAQSISGIDSEQLRSDIEQTATIDQVTIDEELVTASEIEQTPTIAVNGTILEDPFDYDAIQSAIEEALEAEE